MSVAIFPLATVGDGLIYFILAQALADDGQQVNVYSTTLSGLNHRWPAFEINPVPEDPATLHSILDSAELIICGANIAIKNACDQF